MRRRVDSPERQKQTANLHECTLPMLAGIKIKHQLDGFLPVKQVQTGKFDGMQWKLFGSLSSGAVTKARRGLGPSCQAPACTYRSPSPNETPMTVSNPAACLSIA